jgi:hypothetical protein
MPQNVTTPKVMKKNDIAAIPAASVFGCRFPVSMIRGIAQRSRAITASNASQIGHSFGGQALGPSGLGGGGTSGLIGTCDTSGVCGARSAKVNVPA